MSDIDFNNGFMCGIAVKGIPGGNVTGGKIDIIAGKVEFSQSQLTLNGVILSDSLICGIIEKE